MRRLAVILAIIVVTATATPRAEEPAHFTYAPAPPGTTLQSRVVYLAGEAMHAQWRAVLSKKRIGSTSGTAFYQWFLSIYHIDGATYKLRYRSPDDGGPYVTVQASTDHAIWFPMQSGSIAGAGELMGPGVQQLVVATHQTGADCGSADVTILGYNAARRTIVPEATLENGCRLDAKIVGNAVVLSGPYYAANAALCCPTKNDASATLAFAHGKWIEKPRYFKLYPSAFPPS